MHMFGGSKTLNWRASRKEQKGKTKKNIHAGKRKIFDENTESLLDASLSPSPSWNFPNEEIKRIFQGHQRVRKMIRKVKHNQDQALTVFWTHGTPTTKWKKKEICLRIPSSKSPLPFPIMFYRICWNGSKAILIRPSFLFFAKQFQNLSVSSPAPVTMTCPSGDIAKYRTLYVCPVKLTTCVILGYFQTTIWFSE